MWKSHLGVGVLRRVWRRGFWGSFWWSWWWRGEGLCYFVGGGVGAESEGGLGAGGGFAATGGGHGCCYCGGVLKGEVGGCDILGVSQLMVVFFVGVLE